MSWVMELREALRQLQAGRSVPVGFADRAGTVGELGREFNALAEDIKQHPPNGLTREQAHSLRNRLAGILAALHLLRETGAITSEEQKALSQVLAEAKGLDARLRAG